MREHPLVAILDLAGELRHRQAHDTFAILLNLEVNLGYEWFFLLDEGVDASVDSIESIQLNTLHIFLRFLPLPLLNEELELLDLVCIIIKT